jgi:hypothetical protein
MVIVFSKKVSAAGVSGRANKKDSVAVVPLVYRIICRTLLGSGHTGFETRCDKGQRYRVERTAVKTMQPEWAMFARSWSGDQASA